MSLDETHPESLDRVRLRAKGAILQFFREHAGGQFHALELRNYVTRVVGTMAPGSADRVMRNLRQHQVLNYKCLSRRESLYLVLWAPPAVNGAKSNDGKD